MRKNVIEKKGEREEIKSCNFYFSFKRNNIKNRWEYWCWHEIR